MAVENLTFQDFCKGYWNYYLELERLMEETRRYVEYDENNFETYSRYYSMLLFTVCSEIDVVGKEIASSFCESLESEKTKKPINRWWYEIQDNLPGVYREVTFADSYVLNPWDKYRVAKKCSHKNNGSQVDVTTYVLQAKSEGIIFSIPKWWTAYNDVKHKRLKTDKNGVNYKKANLLNLSNAFAALYLLEFEFMAKIGSIEERVACGRSVLFGTENIDIEYIDSLFLESE